MFGKYSKKDMQRLATRLKEEYENALSRERALTQELREQNRTLRARVLELENERKNVADAMIRAEKAGKKLRKDSELSLENERREFELLSEKCRLLSERLLKKYPDEDDAAALAAFQEEFSRKMEGEEDTGFNMDDVLSPKEPLDLGNLCKQLGLMGEEE